MNFLSKETQTRPIDEALPIKTWKPQRLREQEEAQTREEAGTSSAADLLANLFGNGQKMERENGEGKDFYIIVWVFR